MDELGPAFPYGPFYCDKKVLKDHLKNFVDSANPLGDSWPLKLKRARPDGSLRVEGLDPLADGKTHRGFGCSCDGCNWECL